MAFDWLDRRKSRSPTPRRRRSRSPPIRRRRSRSSTPRRHKRQRSISSSLSPLPKSPSPSLKSNEQKNALEKLRKEEEERKRYCFMLKFLFLLVPNLHIWFPIWFFWISTLALYTCTLLHSYRLQLYFLLTMQGNL